MCPPLTDLSPVDSATCLHLSEQPNPTSTHPTDSPGLPDTTASLRKLLSAAEAQLTTVSLTLQQPPANIPSSALIPVNTILEQLFRTTPAAAHTDTTPELPAASNSAEPQLTAVARKLRALNRACKPRMGSSRSTAVNTNAAESSTAPAAAAASAPVESGAVPAPLTTTANNPSPACSHPSSHLQVAAGPLCSQPSLASPPSGPEPTDKASSSCSNHPLLPPSTLPGTAHPADAHANLQARPPDSQATHAQQHTHAKQHASNPTAPSPDHPCMPAHSQASSASQPTNESAPSFSECHHHPSLHLPPRSPHRSRKPVRLSSCPGTSLSTARKASQMDVAQTDRTRVFQMTSDHAVSHATGDAGQQDVSAKG